MEVARVEVNMFINDNFCIFGLNKLKENVISRIHTAEIQH
jgi:hypothetical protein